MASRPERRAARGSSTGSGAAAPHVQQEEIVTESNEPSSGTAPAVSRETLSVHVEGLVRVVAAETCLRRRNARLPGIIFRRLKITADRCASDFELLISALAPEWVFWSVVRGARGSPGGLPVIEACCVGSLVMTAARCARISRDDST
jgi:hypothetical protein